MIHVLTVGHKRSDTRIWVKEIASLKAGGISVRYIVADGEGDETVDGVEINDFGPIPDRIGFRRRIVKMYGVIRDSGLKKGDIVHFHDGIFLPFAYLLWLRGCKVVYDVHEDYPRQVMNSRFPTVVKRIWSLALSLLEWFAGKVFHGFVAATPSIAARFPKHITVLVQNFPLIEELQVTTVVPYQRRSLNVAFIGGLSKLRGAVEMVEAMEIVNRTHNSRLSFGGDLSPKSLVNLLESKPGWRFVDAYGFITRGRVAKLLSDSRVGLVLFHSVPNHINSQPNKLFEYMSAGMPVIASDFPLWRQIIDGSGCGLLVDPCNSQAIADAICWLIEHPEDAEEMGRRGRQAVLDRFNWSLEEQKLLAFYNDKRFLH